jgi:hypothetical protein
MWIYRLPDFGLTLMFAGGFAVLAALMPTLFHRVLRIPVVAQRDAVAFEAYKTLVTITALVLAFSLLQAQINFRNVGERLDREASNLVQFDTMATRFGTPDAAALHPLVKRYLRTVLGEEWKRQDAGDGSPQAEAMLERIEQRVMALEPGTARQRVLYGMLLRTLDDLKDQRDARLAAATTALPSAFWQTVQGLFLLLLIFAGFMPATLERRLYLGSQAAALGLLASLVVIIDHPLSGQTSLGPEPLMHAQMLIDRY